MLISLLSESRFTESCLMLEYAADENGVLGHVSRDGGQKDEDVKETRV